MRKLILAASAAAILAVPTYAVASTGHKAPAKRTKAVKVCVSKTKTGFKARVTAKKCKRGEKAITVHLPAGATGPQGPAGPAGPAGAFVVRDGGGNAFGTLIAYAGGDYWVLLSNGIIEPFNPTTGQIDDQQPFEFTSTDCSGQGYLDTQALQSPVAELGAPVGAPLYVPSGPAQTITVLSEGAPGSCDSFGGSGFTDNAAYTAAASGATQPGSPVGPLTIAPQP